MTACYHSHDHVSVRTLDPMLMAQPAPCSPRTAAAARHCASPLPPAHLATCRRTCARMHSDCCSARRAASAESAAARAASARSASTACARSSRFASFSRRLAGKARAMTNGTSQERALVRWGQQPRGCLESHSDACTCRHKCSHGCMHACTRRQSPGLRPRAHDSQSLALLRNLLLPDCVDLKHQPPPRLLTRRPLGVLRGRGPAGAVTARLPGAGSAGCCPATRACAALPLC